MYGSAGFKIEYTIDLIPFQLLYQNITSRALPLWNCKKFTLNEYLYIMEYMVATYDERDVRKSALLTITLHKAPGRFRGVMYHLFQQGTPKLAANR